MKLYQDGSAIYPGKSNSSFWILIPEFFPGFREVQIMRKIQNWRNRNGTINRWGKIHLKSDRCNEESLKRKVAAKTAIRRSHQEWPSAVLPIRKSLQRLLHLKSRNHYLFIVSILLKSFKRL